MTYTTAEAETQNRRRKSGRRPNVNEVAAEAYRQADDDVQAATAMMVERVGSDLVLYRELMDPLLREACYQAITRHCRSQRSTIYHMPQPSADTARRGVEALAAGTTLSLYDFPLPGGKRLGDATKEEVGVAAQFYQKQSADMGIKGRWLEVIERLVPAGATVRQKLSIAKLQQLRAQAEINQ